MTAAANHLFRPPAGVGDFHDGFQRIGNEPVENDR